MTNRIFEFVAIPVKLSEGTELPLHIPQTAVPCPVSSVVGTICFGLSDERALLISSDEKNEPYEISIGELFEFKNGINKGKEFFGRGTPICAAVSAAQHQHSGVGAQCVL